jgi:hypothetical protein
VLTANSSATNGLDYEAPIALTTTGTSGAASLTPGNPYTLNVPQYSGGGGGGGPTNQNVVTGSRAFNTVYQNTTGKPMWVTVTAQFSATANTAVSAITDSSSTPTTTVGIIYVDFNSASSAYAITFVVLSGNYYKIVPSGNTPLATLNTWTEWY